MSSNLVFVGLPGVSPRNPMKKAATALSQGGSTMAAGTLLETPGGFSTAPLGNSKNDQLPKCDATHR